jgi:prolipoprotein diacylglyceryltransferase
VVLVPRKETDNIKPNGATYNLMNHCVWGCPKHASDVTLKHSHLGTCFSANRYYCPLVKKICVQPWSLFRSFGYLVVKNFICTKKTFVFEPLI